MQPSQLLRVVSNQVSKQSPKPGSTEISRAGLKRTFHRTPGSSWILTRRKEQLSFGTPVPLYVTLINEQAPIFPHPSAHNYKPMINNHGK